jgi:hypothetical protein
LGTKQLCIVALALLSGCATIKPHDRGTDPDVLALSSQIALLTRNVAEMEAQLASLRSEQRGVADQLDLNIDSVDLLAGRVESLPDTLRSLCPPPARRTFECPPPQLQRVMIAEDKMVVGDVEVIWLEPPGLSLTARIDPANSGNALHAEDIVEVERDGAQWVRFAIRANGRDGRVAAEPVQMERPALRFLRVTGGDASGARRPVVALRVRLGDVDRSFEFTIAERSSRPEHIAVLGRSFLTDIALLDVGRQFVQPPYMPRPNVDTAGTADR